MSLKLKEIGSGYIEELKALLADAHGYSPFESSMRLRALSEIAEALNTDALMTLASHVAVADVSSSAA